MGKDREYQIPLGDIGPIRIDQRKRRLVVNPKKRQERTKYDLEAWWEEEMAMLFRIKFEIWKGERAAKDTSMAGENVEESGHIYAEDETELNLNGPIRSSQGHHFEARDIMARAISVARTYSNSRREDTSQFLNHFADIVANARNLSDQYREELKAAIYQTKLPIPRRS